MTSPINPPPRCETGDAYRFMAGASISHLTGQGARIINLSIKTVSRGDAAAILRGKVQPRPIVMLRAEPAANDRR